MDDEVDTYAVIDHIIKSNKKCFIPRYDMKSRHMDMLRVHDVQEIQNMTLTNWKIRQHALDDTRPEEAISTGGLDLILVPGLAFTADGKRCGRGKGYYDTFLNRHSSQLQRRPISVALAFREQVLPDVPVDEHDYTIDHVVIADP